MFTVPHEVSKGPDQMIQIPKAALKMVQADYLTSTPDESALSTGKGWKMHQSHWTSKPPKLEAWVAHLEDGGGQGNSPAGDIKLQPQPLTPRAGGLCIADLSPPTAHHQRLSQVSGHKIPQLSKGC